MTVDAATGAVELMTNMATEATWADKHRYAANVEGRGGDMITRTSDRRGHGSSRYCISIMSETMLFAC